MGITFTIMTQMRGLNAPFGARCFLTNQMAGGMDIGTAWS